MQERVEIEQREHPQPLKEMIRQLSWKELGYVIKNDFSAIQIDGSEAVEENIEYFKAVVQRAGYANRLQVYIQEGTICLKPSEPVPFITRNEGLHYWYRIWSNDLQPAAKALREELGSRQELSYQPVFSQNQVIHDDRPPLPVEQRKRRYSSAASGSHAQSKNAIHATESRTAVMPKAKKQRQIDPKNASVHFKRACVLAETQGVRNGKKFATRGGRYNRTRHTPSYVWNKLTVAARTNLSAGLSASELEEIKIVYHQHYTTTLVSLQKKSSVLEAEYYGKTNGYTAAKRGKIFDENETEESVWAELIDKKKEELLVDVDEDKKAEIKSVYYQSFLANLKKHQLVNPVERAKRLGEVNGQRAVHAGRISQKDLTVDTVWAKLMPKNQRKLLKGVASASGRDTEVKSAYYQSYISNITKQRTDPESRAKLLAIANAQIAASHGTLYNAAQHTIEQLWFRLSVQTKESLCQGQDEETIKNAYGNTFIETLKARQLAPNDAEKRRKISYRRELLRTDFLTKVPLSDWSIYEHPDKKNYPDAAVICFTKTGFNSQRLAHYFQLYMAKLFRDLSRDIDSDLNEPEILPVGQYTLVKNYGALYELLQDEMMALGIPSDNLELQKCPDAIKTVLLKTQRPIGQDTESEQGQDEFAGLFANFTQPDSCWDERAAEVQSLAEKLAADIDRENAVCHEPQDGFAELVSDFTQSDSCWDGGAAEVQSLAEKLAADIDRENALYEPQEFEQEVRGVQREDELAGLFADFTQPDSWDVESTEGQSLGERPAVDVPVSTETSGVETQSVGSSQAKKLRFFTPFSDEREIKKYSHTPETASNHGSFLS